MIRRPLVAGFVAGWPVLLSLVRLNSTLDTIIRVRCRAIGWLQTGTRLAGRSSRPFELDNGSRLVGIWLFLVCAPRGSVGANKAGANWQ